MAGTGLLDRLTFKSESDSESEPNSALSSESDSDSELLDPDPVPKRSKRSVQQPDTPKVTATAKKNVRETLDDLVSLPVMLFKRADPTCGAVVEEQQSEIVDAALAIIIKRPAWVAALTDLGSSGDIIKMLKALYPVVMVVYAHHVARTVGREEGPDDDLSSFQAPRLAG